MARLTETIIGRLKDAGLECFLGAGSDLSENVFFEAPCSIKWMQIHYKLSIGAFSYAVKGFYFNVGIGRYTSIGEDVQVGRSDHPTSWVSTSPALYSHRLFNVGDQFEQAAQYQEYVPALPPGSSPATLKFTDIGHDVYIGHGAFIRPGVKIGHGAIVGAHAVVVKDVPPYAIVAGNPAVVKKYKIPESLIERYLAVGWWRFAPWQMRGINFTDPSEAIGALEALVPTLTPYEPGIRQSKDFFFDEAQRTIPRVSPPALPQPSVMDHAIGAKPRIVYGIMCHNSALFVAEQFSLLFRADVHFIYHVDAKAPTALKELVARLAISYRNVSVLPSVLCSWAGISLTSVMLDMIKSAIGIADWEHLIFLSEQHLPLQDYNYIYESLKTNHNYVGIHPYTAYPDAGKSDIAYRFSKKFVELPGVGAFATISATPQDEFFDHLAHGSQWMTLCRASCLRLLATDVITRLDDFTFSVLSDETGIQTLIFNVSDSDVTNVNRILTLVAGPHSGGDGNINFTEDGFFAARDNGYLFIRKRNENIPSKVRDYLDEIFPTLLRPELPAIQSAAQIPDKYLAVTSVIAALNTATAARGIALKPMPLALIGPALFCRVAHTSLSYPFDVYVLSEDIFNFKVIAIFHEFFNGYSDSKIGDYEASVVRARLHDIANHREIHVASDHNHGFYSNTGHHDINNLAALIEIVTFRTAELSLRYER